MTEYSSPYKVGLINVGTTFAQSRLVWSGITYGRLNFRCTVILVRRFVASANLAPHKSAQVIIHCGTRYVDFFFVRRFNFRFGPSSLSGFRFDLRFGFEKCEGLVSTMVRQQAAKYPCVPSGGPWCVSFEVSRFMDTCLTPRSSEPGRRIIVGAHPMNYLISVNG